MKFSLKLILICALFTNCQSNIQSKKQEFLAQIEDMKISTEQVDSIISNQTYQLKKEALKKLLRDKVIDIQSKKLRITKEELLNLNTENKSKVSSEQYNSYLSQQGISPKNVDSIQMVKYLLTINEQQYFEHFADSLLANSDLKIYLEPRKFREVNLNDLDYHELSSGTKIIVYILSDYNCNACQNAEKRLRKIIKEYSQSVSFRFVFFSEYIDKKALIAEASANQEKFIDTHDYLFDHPEINEEDRTLFEFARKKGFDMQLFEEDVYNPSTLKKLLINKEKIIKQNIYITPSFVINNKLVNDEFSLYILENLINEEL